MTPDRAFCAASDEAEVIAISLSEDERAVLMCGLLEWGGPAYCTDALVFAMDFGTVDELLSVGIRLRDQVSQGKAMSRFDWRRTLLATEIVFASDVVGSGVDWESTTGRSDEDTIGILRSLQRKIIGA